MLRKLAVYELNSFIIVEGEAFVVVEIRVQGRDKKISGKAGGVKG